MKIRRHVRLIPSEEATPTSIPPPIESRPLTLADIRTWHRDEHTESGFSELPLDFGRRLDGYLDALGKAAVTDEKAAAELRGVEGLLDDISRVRALKRAYAERQPPWAVSQVKWG